MKTTKMSLANIQGKLSRNEMRSIMAGSGAGGTCKTDSRGSCYCSSGNTSACNSTCSNSC